MGFFGGTFDPPHIGHLAVAHAAVQQFGLDRLMIAPTGRQPLKEASPGASFAERLAMVRLLCEDVPQAEASELEAPSQSGAANYTVDTLRALREDLAAEDELFVIVGADAFRGLRQWRSPEELLALAQWIVVSRPGFALEDLAAELELNEEQRTKVHSLSGVNVPVSATELRQKLSAGEDCTGLIPANVLAFIDAQGLYRHA